MFRAAVVEAFIIPTGSMAPTLLGRHVRLHSPLTGESWAVGATRERGLENVRVTDPITRLRVGADAAPVGAGDRIFVYKSATFFRVPPRWSVIVFKNPENPGENYIKRLIGRPDEQVWLVDGDVFVREGEAEWRIARKPRRVQDALWWTLYSSELAPDPEALGDTRWRAPWVLKVEDGDEAIDTNGREFAISDDRPHTLTWDDAVHPITDEVAYNDSPMLGGGRVFPTGDVRARLAVKPDAPGFATTMTISTKSHDFRFEANAERTRLSMRRFDADDAEWTVLSEQPSDGFRPGAWASLSFAFVDQRLEARVNDQVVARRELEWSAAERLALATGLNSDAIERILSDERDTSLADPGLYRRSAARVRIDFEGAPATLAHVGLDRDVSFSPTDRASGEYVGEMGLASHPLRAADLDSDQLFALGDNSASSRDGRLWDRVDPRVAATFGRDYGVVPLDLLVGRAFMVYFPAPHEVRLMGKRRPLVPDVGRVRLIK
jgi:signal peptidase I